jgi:hypothetical protein
MKLFYFKVSNFELISIVGYFLVHYDVDGLTQKRHGFFFLKVFNFKDLDCVAIFRGLEPARVLKISWTHLP